MRVLVSGSSGMIGRAVVQALRGRGDEVGSLVRGAGAASGLDVRWDPGAGTIDADALAEGRFDAVVHLAGETLVGRWTREKRDRILSSRVDGTRTLAEALASLAPDVRPRVLLCASATGWYGDRGDELLPDDAPAGRGFLASVVQAWEAAADPARAAGIRTAHLRMSAVQSPDGGALGKQLLPFRLGLGGPIGSGAQWMAWIGLHEVTRVVQFALDDDRFDGPVNCVGPTPCRNRDHAKALGRVLGRPAVLPVPALALKLAMGADLVDEMLLASQKVVPARLEGLGFEFVDRTIEDALRRELGRG